MTSSCFLHPAKAWDVLEAVLPFQLLYDITRLKLQDPLSHARSAVNFQCHMDDATCSVQLCRQRLERSFYPGGKVELLTCFLTLTSSTSHTICKCCGVLGCCFLSLAIAQRREQMWSLNWFGLGKLWINALDAWETVELWLACLH